MVRIHVPGLLALVILATAGIVACRFFEDDGRHLAILPEAGEQVTPPTLESLRPAVAAFCGDCHETPSPGAFPKVAWDEEVRRGYDFYFKSGRTDLTLPDFEQVVDWFKRQAPSEIVVPRPTGPDSPSKLRFRTSPIAADLQELDRQPVASFIRFGDLAPGEPGALLWCNMQSGELRAVDPHRPHSDSRLLGLAANPVHASPCDLDGDGRLDLVVADLGQFLPSDHTDGKVVWLRNTTDAGWQSIVLQAGLGRVADVEPGDFDADGDVDLVVAEFGWWKTGRIILLENMGSASSAAGVPAFRMSELDPRHGTIHVPVVDLDGDGRLDFVALISQEYETVIAFMNDGAGGFRRETIFAANEPSFGSTGIQLVDLDRDGDLDVLYTNGDSFDSFYLKPFHSIRWLENQGTFPFLDRELALMPGVHRALACDLDGDGDLDIAACSLLPDRMHDREARQELDSVLWLEQAGAGTFVRHRLEGGACEHPALEVGDFDADGDVDMAVGTFGYSAQARYPALTVWWNQRQ